MSIDLFTGYLNGVEPYHSFFHEIAQRSTSVSKKERCDARRAWLAFMREHAEDYLTRWPESTESLIQYLYTILTQARHIRPETRESAEAVLEIAQRVRQPAS